MPSTNITPGGTAIAARPAGLRTLHNATATTGTDSACTSGTAYYGSIWIPGDVLVTGVQFLVGSTGGTDKVVASIHDESGALLANTAVAGATVGTAAQTQQVALTVPYLLQGPALVLVALTFNGTTAKFRSVPAYCDGGMIAGSSTQTFGTPAALTVSTTKFTADKSPLAALY